MTPTLLIVDDEKATREGLRTALEDKFDVYVAADAPSAWLLLEKEAFDVVLTDLRMAGEDGLSLIKRAKALPKPPVCILMTAYGSEDLAVEAMKQGADDYISKGRLQIDELELRIQRSLKRQRLESENEQLHQRLDSRFGLQNIIGESPSMKEIFDQIQQIGPTRATVLITGESGTGKELVAKAIHQLSQRARGPMVTVNCAAIPANLLEAELFGHEKGAFTGAHERRIGRVEQAQNGTLFLDEIGDMSLSAQAKVLRALQENKIMRVGGEKEIPVNVRVVAATNKNLLEEVKNKSFREDLYHRLSVILIHVPSLNERAEDIPMLAAHFMQFMAENEGKAPSVFMDEALEELKKIQFTGNIRELRNIIERLAILCGPVITADDIRKYAQPFRS